MRSLALLRSGADAQALPDWIFLDKEMVSMSLVVDDLICLFMFSLIKNYNTFSTLFNSF